MREHDTIPVSEFADRLGLADSTVYRWCTRGRIQAEKFAGHWRVARTELERLLKVSAVEDAQERVSEFLAVLEHRTARSLDEQLRAAVDRFTDDFRTHGASWTADELRAHFAPIITTHTHATASLEAFRLVRTRVAKQRTEFERAHGGGTRTEWLADAPTAPDAN